MASTFSQLILYVTNRAKSLRFYRDLLHLKVKDQFDEDGYLFATIDTGGTEILLIQQPKEEQNPMIERSSALMLKLQTRDLPALARIMEEEHVNVIRPLDMAIWGERTFLIADPDGYPVLLSEPVATVH